MCRGAVGLPLPIIIAIYPFYLAKAATSKTGSFFSHAAVSASVATFSFFNPKFWENKINSLTSKIAVTSAAQGILPKAMREKLASWYVRRAVLYILGKHFDWAVSDLEKANTLLDESKTIPLYLLAFVHQLNGRLLPAVTCYTAAIATLKELTEEDAKNHLGQEAKTLLHGSMEGFEDSNLQRRDGITTKMLSWIPGFGEPLKQTMEGRVDEDTKQMTLLKEFNDNLKGVTLADLYNFRGTCYLNASMEELQSAANDFSSAVQLDSDNMAYLYNYALSVFFARNNEKAFQAVSSCAIMYHKQAAESNTEAMVLKQALRLQVYLGQLLDKPVKIPEVEGLNAEDISSTIYYQLLPESVMVHMLSFLPLGDLVRTMRTCRHLFKLCSTPFLWSYYHAHSELMMKQFNDPALYLGTPELMAKRMHPMLARRYPALKRIRFTDDDLQSQFSKSSFMWSTFSALEFMKPNIFDQVEEVTVENYTCDFWLSPYVLRDLFKSMKKLTLIRSSSILPAIQKIEAELPCLEEVVLVKCKNQGSVAFQSPKIKITIKGK